MFSAGIVVTAVIAALADSASPREALSQLRVPLAVSCCVSSMWVFSWHREHLLALLGEAARVATEMAGVRAELHHSVS